MEPVGDPALVLLALGAGALGVTLSLTLGLCLVVARVRAWADAARIRRRFRRGVRGQRRARVVLERLGFEILSEEQELTAQMEVDGERVGYTVRIDYLVSRRGKTYGVEVKTGARATDPLHRQTRRQLLEYSVALPRAVHGLMLLDMERQRLMVVRFPRLRGSRTPSPAVWLALGIFLGAAGAVGATLVGL